MKRPVKIALAGLGLAALALLLGHGAFALWLRLAAAHKGAEDRPATFYEPPAQPSPRGTAPPRFTIGRLGDRYQILDAQGRIVLLRGLNVGQGSANPPWRPVAMGDRAAFAQMRSWGVNALRFVLPWEALEPAAGTLNLDHIGYVRWFLDEAYAHGMLVILDNHQDEVSRCFGGAGAPVWAHRPGVVTDGDLEKECRFHGAADLVDLPRQLRWWADFWDGSWSPDALTLQDHAINAWTKLAEVVRGHPALLGYGPFTQPHCYADWFTDAFYPGQQRCQEAVSDFHRRFARAIRAVDPDALLFVENPALRGTHDDRDGRAAGITRPPVDGVVLSVRHFHDDVRDPDCDATWDPADCGLAPFLQDARELAATRFQAPAVLAAFGVNPCRRGSFEDLSHQMVDIEDAGVSAFLWNYTRTGETRGMSGPGEGGEDLSVVVPEVRASDPSQVGKPRCFARAFVRPYPVRLAGTLESYGFDRSYESWQGQPPAHHDGRPITNTDTFQLTFRQGAVTGDSFVWIPRTSIYGDDPSTEAPELTIDVSDGRWRWSDSDPNLLVWTTASAVPVHTLTVRTWGGRRAPGNGIGECVE